MRARRLAPVLAAGLLVAAGCGGTSRESTPRLFGVAAAGPGCSTAAVAAPALSVHTALEQVGQSPFGITVTPDGRWSFLDLVSGHVAVFSDAGFAPRLVRTINISDGDAVGSSLTRDGRYLLVTDGDRGATVISVRRAEMGGGNAVLGTLAPPAGVNVGQGSIEVTSSPGRPLRVRLDRVRWRRRRVRPAGGAGRSLPPVELPRTDTPGTSRRRNGGLPGRTMAVCDERGRGRRRAGRRHVERDQHRDRGAGSGSERRRERSPVAAPRSAWRCPPTARSSG